MRYNPTEEEIRELCAEIQKGWDEETRRSRLVDKRLDPNYVFEWTVPEIPAEGDIGNELTDGDMLDTNSSFPWYRNVDGYKKY